MPRRSKHDGLLTHFFTKLADPPQPPRNHSVISSDCYKCKYCQPIFVTWIKKGKGYTNLLSHAKADHLDEYHSFESAEHPENIAQFAVPILLKNGRNLTGWIELYTETQESLAFVKNPTVRKHTKLEPICVNTLKKYVRLVYTETIEVLKSKLFKRFGILFNGWKHGPSSTEFVAIFACAPNELDPILLRFFYRGVINFF
ncbi:hypothetical protein GEMRC1_000510 [Eukaryota sp. GEM-RC1]